MPKPCARALFTLAVACGNRGFLAIGDWLKAYYDDLVRLFNPPKGRLPSYSTIRRVLLKVDYEQYSACLARFFAIQPQPGETIAADGKVLRGSYQLESDNPHSEPHPAIMLVSAYIVERGLILEPVRCGLENQRASQPCRNLFSAWHFKGWWSAFDAISTQKKLQRQN